MQKLTHYNAKVDFFSFTEYKKTAIFKFLSCLPNCTNVPPAGWSSVLTDHDIIVHGLTFFKPVKNQAYLQNFAPAQKAADMVALVQLKRYMGFLVAFSALIACNQNRLSHVIMGMSHFTCNKNIKCLAH